jgi:hypothetical protein
VNKIAIALVLGAVFAVGCGDKGADGAKSGAAASGSAKADSKGGSSGTKSCDDYWAKVKECNEKHQGLVEGPQGRRARHGLQGHVGRLQVPEVNR